MKMGPVVVSQSEPRNPAEPTRPAIRGERYEIINVDCVRKHMNVTQRTASIKRLYQEIAEDYAKEYWGKASPYDKYINRFLSYLPKRARILDAGCGAGDSTDYFLKRGFAAEGIDITPKFVSMAKKRVPKAKFSVMDIRRLRYRPGTFDAVYSFGVLEHIPKGQLDMVLGEFSRVLKPKGYFFITVPRGRGEHLVYYPLAKRRFKASLYTLKELTNLLSKAGFRLVSHDFVPRSLRLQARYNRIFAVAVKA